ncbi:B12-binding domain-containing radical SAM protein, partial [Pseudomonadota bacterium]
MKNEFFQAKTKALLVQSKFSSASFWNYVDVCELTGAKYTASPLGLMTVAALLPQHWEFKLVDVNVEPLTDEHFKWADIVFTGGMLPQQNEILKTINRAHQFGRLVAVGGPDPTSQPKVYESADFLVTGEGEITIPMFLEDLHKGIKKGRYYSEEKADMSNAVVPRFDLIDFKNYMQVGIQYTRGCPFLCEFCDIIELYGRVPRSKTNEQVILELQTL